MNYFYLTRSVLFQGLTKEDIDDLLPYFNAEVKNFEKDEVIFAAGSPITKLGLILKGDVRVEHVTPWGRVDILFIMEEGKTFAEAGACAPAIDNLVDFVADHDCTVLFLDANIIMRSSGGAHSKRSIVAANLTALLAQRNLELARRAFVMTSRTIRDKVMAYLSTASKAYGSNEFSIPYNREQLASYLGVDRSALSSELGRMQSEGLIEFKKNRFKLL